MKTTALGKLNSPDFLGILPIHEVGSQANRTWSMLYKLRPDLFLSDENLKQMTDDISFSKLLTGFTRKSPAQARVGRPRKETPSHIVMYNFLSREAGLGKDEQMAEQVARKMPGNNSPTNQLRLKNEISKEIKRWKDSSKKTPFPRLKIVAQILAEKTKLNLSLKSIEEFITPESPEERKRIATAAAEAMLLPKRMAIDYLRRWCPAIAAVAIDELCNTETSLAKREVLLQIRHGFPQLDTPLEDWLLYGRKISNFNGEVFTRAWEYLFKELLAPLSKEHPEWLWWYLI